jgi:murein DD-endopeptidase MepM/ murein hydrolase activator NlpD
MPQITIHSFTANAIVESFEAITPNSNTRLAISLIGLTLTTGAAQALPDFAFRLESPRLELPQEPEPPELPTIAPATPITQYISPAQGILTSSYGWRWGRMHKGIDIAAPIGTPIVAAASGTVITAGWNSGGYGYLVEIQHPDGSITLYAHNNRLLVRKGKSVMQGQPIAEMGSTGYSTGPHCHFEIHLPGKGAVNPIAFLPSNKISQL